jgi:hypothetical protein
MIFFNLLNFVGFSIGKYFLRKNFTMSFMSSYSMALGGFLILYLIGNLSLCIYFFSFGNKFFSLVSAIFFFLPFIYGSLSSYKTADIYINAQILTFLINSVFIGETILKIF